MFKTYTMPVLMMALLLALSTLCCSQSKAPQPEASQQPQQQGCDSRSKSGANDRRAGSRDNRGNRGGPGLYTGCAQCARSSGNARNGNSSSGRACLVGGFGGGPGRLRRKVDGNCERSPLGRVRTWRRSIQLRRVLVS